MDTAWTRCARSRPRGGCLTVVLTAAMHDDELTEAMALGVAGIVLKESPPASLVDCVRDVHRGERRIDLETLTRAVEHQASTAARCLASGRGPR